jgi:hypothetical protein
LPPTPAISTSWFPSVEKFLQVEIYGPAPTLGNIPSCAIHRLLGIASGTKTITRFREPGIEQGLQYMMKCLLDQAIQRTGNAQDAYPALRLRYLHLAHCSRHGFTRQQSLFYLRPVRLQPWLLLQNREPIDSRCSFVFHHPRVGAHHVAAFQRSFQKSLRCLRFRFSIRRRTSLGTRPGP